ncbi:MAG: hypothetical protein ABIY52_08060 [Gemmatimonadaceae bacterium]
MRLSTHTVVLALIAAAAGCGSDRVPASARAAEAAVPDDSVSRARMDSMNRAQPGYVIDSIFPPDEEMRRFRASLPGDSAIAFVGGASSREALVRRFVSALSRNDTLALRSMAVRGREFADLYYAESPYSKAPYRQPPSFAWRMIQDPSSAGFAKLLRRLGGKPMTYVAHRCDPSVQVEGATTRYAGCLVEVVNATGDTATKRYFGSIVQRGGQYKFLSYTNYF